MTLQQILDLIPENKEMIICVPHRRGIEKPYDFTFLNLSQNDIRTISIKIGFSPKDFYGLNKKPLDAAMKEAKKEGYNIDKIIVYDCKKPTPSICYYEVITTIVRKYCKEWIDLDSESFEIINSKFE